MHKRFGDLDAVRTVTFQVRTGETFGFLGPNGAGKSTTISMLCTLLQPTSGRARVAGADVVTQRGKVRSRIGLVFQDPTLDEYLTAEENLRFHAELYGVPPAILESRLDQILEMVELQDRRHDVVQNFSGGMRRRLEIARGLLHSPRVLFLDEPTVGLDPRTRSHIWSYIETLRRAEQITIFLTTHYMDEAEHCDRIAIIDHGEIVALDSPAALTAFGVLLASRIQQMQSFSVVVQFFVMPLFFLSGAVFPLVGLPSWLNALTKIDPLTYAVDPLRTVVFAHLSVSPAALASLEPGTTWNGWRLPIGVELAIVAVFAAVLLGTAMAAFSRE